MKFNKKIKYKPHNHTLSDLSKYCSADDCSTLTIDRFSFLEDKNFEEEKGKTTFIKSEGITTVSSDRRSCLDKDGYWHVYPILDKDGYWHVYPIYISKYNIGVICPHCGQIHIHGITDGKYEGHRCSDCTLEPNNSKSGNIVEDLLNLNFSSY